MKYEDIYKAYIHGFKVNVKDIPLEKYFQKKIMDYLKTLPNCFFWKAQAGAYSKSGIPDICCVYKGRFYAFEVKRPWIGKLSDLQKNALYKINKSGGKASVVSFVEEVESIMRGEAYN